MSSEGLTRPWSHCTPLFPLLFPSFHPNLALGGGRAAIAPAKRGQIPPCTPSLHLFHLFLPRFPVAGQEPIAGETLTPQGPLLWGGVPNLEGVPSSVGVPNPGGVPVSSGIPHLSGVPQPPLVAGEAFPNPRNGGRGTPSDPPGFGGHKPRPLQPQVLGVSQVWGGAGPPALTQPCSCSAPGRGRSPAAASLALVWGGD